MNIQLLRKIQKQIENTPQKFLMGGFENEIIDEHTHESCGTAYCIAGWACVLSGETLGSAAITADGIDGRACELLGLDPTDHIQKWRLFTTEDWPEQFQAIDGDPELPALAIARIDHFIATEGRE